ncbi:MAG: hypothetical protein UV12_C0005G0051, partial [Candidatus Nomurabacteria bacterium GW2011_GWC2_42_20]
FKRAYELEPKYDMAQKYYAQVLMASGKRVEAEKIMGVQSTN